MIPLPPLAYARVDGFLTGADGKPVRGYQVEFWCPPSPAAESTLPVAMGMAASTTGADGSYSRWIAMEDSYDRLPVWRPDSTLVEDCAVRATYRNDKGGDTNYTVTPARLPVTFYRHRDEAVPAVAYFRIVGRL